MKTKLFILALFAFLSGSVLGQPAALPTRDLAVHEINSINPQDTAFADLDFLKKELVNKRVIFLGEPTHGEGNVFEAKARLVNHLSRELGFNTVAFESGFYDVAKAQEQVDSKGYSLQESLSMSLFPVWTQAQEFQPLLQIITQNKLKVAGFDPQLSGENAELLVEELRLFLAAGAGVEKIDFDYLEEVTLFMGEHYAFPPSHKIALFEKQVGKAMAVLDRLQNLNQTQVRKAAFWRQCLRGLARLASDYANNDPSGKSAETFLAKDSNIRDALMAENLLFLLRQDPESRIICWGATTHFLKNVSALDNEELQAYEPMGSIVRKAIPGQVYVLGFTTSEGSYGNVFSPAKEVPVPSPGSLEEKLGELGVAYAFINTSEGLKGKTATASVVEYKPLTGKWDQVLDGIFYLKSVHPPHPLSINRHAAEQRRMNDSEPKGTDVGPTRHEKATRSVIVGTSKQPVAQVNGVVYDRETREGIPFATVTYYKGQQGTVTNINGEFTLPARQAVEGDSLVVSCIGYEQQVLRVQEPLAIWLQPKSYALRGVSIEAEQLTAKKLMEKALKRIPENYPQESFIAEVYTRASSTNFDTLVHDVEYVSTLYNPGGYNGAEDIIAQTDEVKWNKRAPARKSQLFQYSISGKVLQGLDLVNDNPLFKLRHLRKFTLKLGPMAQIGDQETYVVEFEANKQSFRTTGMHYVKRYSGKVYINASDYAIVKCEVVWERDTALLNSFAKKYYAKGGRPARLWHDLYKEYRVSQTLAYAPDGQGKYFLSASRSIWKEVRYDMLNKEDLEVKAVLAVYGSRAPVSDINAGMPGEKANRLLLEEVPYHPVFWESYQAPLTRNPVKELSAEYQ